MWFMPEDAATSWRANLRGSPATVANDPEERAAIFLVWADIWYDGTPAPLIVH